MESRIQRKVKRRHLRQREAVIVAGLCLEVVGDLDVVYLHLVHLEQSFEASEAEVLEGLFQLLEPTGISLCSFSILSTDWYSEWRRTDVWWVL